MAISDPTESTPLNRSPENNLLQVISSAAQVVPNLAQIRPWGLLGKWVKYNNFLFIYSFFRELTRPNSTDPLTDFTFDGTNDAE